MRALRPVVAIALIGAFVAATLTGFVGAEAHPGHIQKKLFPARWYDTSVYLETSFDSPVALTCDGNFNVCASKWLPPTYAALTNWNAQTTTAAFAADTYFDENEDVVIRVEDVVLGDPGILGIALAWDYGNNYCPLGSCGIFRWGEAWIGDNGHSGVFGVSTVRQATIAHELGHLLSLRHESVNWDESILYECGFDDTGPIPASIMSYDCIDPPAVGGSGAYLVHPFDVCGVNHAYYEPAIGYVGCPPVPTPTPSPTPVPTATPSPTPIPTPTPTPGPTPVPSGPNGWGNVDCSSSGINSVDGLKVLRYSSALSVSQTDPCPDIGMPHPDVPTQAQGDIDCSGGINSVDALKLLRYTVGLSVQQNQPCPAIALDP